MIERFTQFKHEQAHQIEIKEIDGLLDRSSANLIVFLNNNPDISRAGIKRVWRKWGARRFE